MILLCLFLFCITITVPVIGTSSPEWNDNPGFPCGRNATYKSCPNPCPGTCSNTAGPQICYKLCLEKGCECNPGYVLFEGRCILPRDCPDYLRCHGDRNTTIVKCPNPCPRTCKYPGGTGPCNKMCMREGCQCKDGYYLNKYGKCVLFQDCPRAGRCTADEIFVFCKSSCQNQVCPENDNRNTVACSQPYPCKSGCVCKPNYLRRSREDDRCIPAYKCPPVPCRGPNEEWDGCPPPCLNERCADIRTKTDIDQRFFTCRPRCVCRPGFCRNDSDICVPEKPPELRCGFNEIPVTCKTVCPPESCDIAYTEYACGKPTCEPGCDCLPDHLRNTSGICILNEECPPPPTCDIPIKCRPTCAVPNPPGCMYSPSETNVDGCKCQEGYVLSGPGGMCIQIEKCPTNIGCNGDPNSTIKRWPQPCPSTCDAPNSPFHCKLPRKPVGCECKPGYIRSANGKCILANDCEYGNPCGPNGTFVPCKYTCLSSYCPKNNSRDVSICRPPQPSECGSGCICKLNYRLLSVEVPKCIRADECPPLKCPRNEIWNSCPDECNQGTCEDVGKPHVPCMTFVLNCNPRCTCKEGYFRDRNSGVCVTAEECREISESEECDDK